MTTVYFSFSDRENARRFVAAALDHGASTEDISVLAQNEASWSAIEHAEEVERTAEHGLTTTTSGDAAMGAVAGAGVGIGVGILASLATLFIPGVGLVVGGGALAAALAGTAGSMGAGAIAGGMYGYLRDLGIPSDESEAFAADFSANHIIVAVTLAPERLSHEELWQLADKYHAGRRLETGPTAAY